NDLDLETLELLEERLVEWPGTLLLVSHDRAFLDNIVTSTFAFEGGGRVHEHVGGYEDWLRHRKSDVGSQKSEVGRLKTEVGTQKTDGVVAVERRKLSYNEQRELEALPARIEALEGEQRALNDRIAGPDFYKEAPGAIREALARVG